MHTRMVRAFVGIGSVVAPDSALVGVAGPIATPSAAACLPLYWRVSVIFRQDRLQGMPRDQVDTSYNEILAFCNNNVLYEVCPGPGPPPRKGIYWQWVTLSLTLTVTHCDSSQVYLHTNLVYACIKEKLRALPPGLKHYNCSTCSLC